MTFDAVMKSIMKNRSPRNVLDPIRSRILFEETLSETLHSIDELTLDELLWLNEEIEIKVQLEDAVHKDQERMSKIKSQTQ